MVIVWPSDPGDGQAGAETVRQHGGVWLSGGCATGAVADQSAEFAEIILREQRVRITSSLSSSSSSFLHIIIIIIYAIFVIELCFNILKLMIMME